MKLQIASLLLLPVASAFVPTASRPTFGSRLLMTSDVVTGPGGKAATSAEEDLALTLKIIMGHDSRSVTVSEEQFLTQMNEETTEEEAETIDISIPYDAAAKLAYESSDKSMKYDDFKVKYEADAVSLVISKQPIDISIPYDAAAKLAYESSDKSMKYDDFKVKYEADTVEMVKSKQNKD